MPVTSAKAAQETINYILTHDDTEVRASVARGHELEGYADALKVCAGEVGMTEQGFFQSIEGTKKLLNLPGLDKTSAAFQSAVTSTLIMVAGQETSCDSQILQALVQKAEPDSLTKALSGLFKAVAERQVVKQDKRFLDDRERLGMLFAVLGGNVHTAHTEAQQELDKQKEKALAARGALLNNPQRDGESAKITRKTFDSLDKQINQICEKQSEMLNLYGRLRNL